MDILRWLPVEVTQPMPGVYSVHQAGQAPAEGTAVYRYSWGWKCEQHGTQEQARFACPHMAAVLQCTAEQKVAS